ncbi:MAG: hypothetical protein JWP52_3976 [Rhizobacter sp.]|nr:hypothetical protein [Rhizobacter sp.]
MGAAHSPPPVIKLNKPNPTHLLRHKGQNADMRFTNSAAADAQFNAKSETVRVALPHPAIWARGITPGQHYSNLQSAQKTPKDERPPPANYLKDTYIQDHLKLFAAGTSFLVPLDCLEKYGREKLGRPSGQFVMPKAQVDQILRQAQGNVAVVEQMLGLPEGSWAGKTIARIDIAPQALSGLNLRMPPGNTKCANELWLAGGYLPTGVAEAMVDGPTRRQYIETIAVQGQVTLVNPGRSPSPRPPSPATRAAR